MIKMTVTDYEAEMTRLEAAIRQTANMTVADPDLTPEGQKRRHRAWSKERRWAEQFDTIATGITSALEGAQAKADAARATMTTLATGPDAHAQEQRLNRRRKRIDAALDVSAGGTGKLVDLIASADDAELPFVLEYIADHHEAQGGDAGKAGAQIVEEALRQRSPEYAQAAKVAGAAGNALTITREKLDYLGRLLDDPSTPAPKEWDVAGMSITVVIPDVADLAA